jgi:hypothetical protein
MRKNIIIIILTVLLVGSLYYSYQQKTNVDHIVAVCEKEKTELTSIAEEQQNRASEALKMAEIARTDAMIQRSIAEEQIKALKNK